MYDNYNFPIGSDTPSAPWNQKELPEKDFKVSVCQCLSKSTEVTTNDYIHSYTKEWDDMGGIEEDITDTSDTDWNQAYKESHYTPLELINAFKSYLELEVERMEGVKNTRHYKKLIEECKGWVEDDYEVVEE